ncbi:MAG: hypothetical protein WCD70_12095 [Alphaproteobacteria bacterium]
MVDESYKTPMLLVSVVVVALLTYGAITMQDQRPERGVSAVALVMPQIVEEAGRQSDNRTTAQKIGDAIKNIGEQIKNDNESSDD